jgi:NADH-quinone oxidoreductase subunit C
MTALDRANQLSAKFPGQFGAPAEFRGEVTLVLKDAEQIEAVCAVAKKEFGYNYLVDVSSVDNYGDDPRFEIVYHLYGLEHRSYLRLKISVSEEKCEVPTVTNVWASANWHEREIYDMMGIRFRSHPDLRRILMWEGYPYFPLRKDFPLAGKPSDVPGVAFTQPAPMAGGPFVTSPGAKDVIEREPRAKTPDQAK